MFDVQDFLYRLMVCDHFVYTENIAYVQAGFFVTLPSRPSLSPSRTVSARTPCPPPPLRPSTPSPRHPAVTSVPLSQQDGVSPDAVTPPPPSPCPHVRPSLPAGRCQPGCRPPSPSPRHPAITSVPLSQQDGVSADAVTPPPPSPCHHVRPSLPAGRCQPGCRPPSPSPRHPAITSVPLSQQDGVSADAVTPPPPSPCPHVRPSLPAGRCQPGCRPPSPSPRHPAIMPVPLSQQDGVSLDAVSPPALPPSPCRHVRPSLPAGRCQPGRCVRPHSVPTQHPGEPHADPTRHDQVLRRVQPRPPPAPVSRVGTPHRRRVLPTGKPQPTRGYSHPALTLTRHVATVTPP